ncbi:MFS transporter [Streptomyces dysideae]|uniref:MFS transporter n=1 Tax=Streptomyces dysideae TaxID=909626 RepID=UPI0008314BEF|nr:MFS transporter [Streptomyces dysideae]
MSEPVGKEASPLWRLDGVQALLAAGSLLNAIAFFAAMPFASIYLASNTSLSAVAIGAVVGSIALIASVGGVVGGMLVDRFGTVPMMVLGLSAYVCIYAGLTVADGAPAIVSLLLGLGVARLFVEPGGKKLMSLAADEDGRIFRVRYMVLCIGGIVGPAIGGVLYSIGAVVFFAVPAVFYTGYLLLILGRRKQLAALEGGAEDGGPRFPLGAALRDRALLAATAAGLVIFFVFSQFESMIPLYMAGEWGEDAVHYFAGLFIANAVLALLLQVAIVWLSRKLRPNLVIVIGCVGFALSFACFYAAATEGLFMLYLGIVFWTVGEGVLLPLPDIAVHEIASDDRKGTYFGVAEIRYLGFFAGPFVGGLLLGGDAVYFVVMALSIFVCAPLLMSRRKTAVSNGGTEVTVGADV